MIAVDTNVLFYAHDSRDREKQRKAIDLIGSLYEEGVLLWQVACEYLWASRKLAPQGYSYAEALAEVNGLRRAWATVLPTWKVLDRLETLKSKYGVSHWDALLVGTCLEAGVHTLYSEDLDTHSKIESLEILNRLPEPVGILFFYLLSERISMRPDLYTKGVLTVIALLLAMIVFRQYVSPSAVVQAQGPFAGVLYAHSNSNDDFFYTRTGEVWIYEDDNKPIHKRLTKLGSPEVTVK